MIVWFLSFAAGLLAASVHYGRPAPAQRLPALLRLVAVTLVVALALDARAGRASAPASRVALDVSQSWLRATDSTAWKAALDSARRIGGAISYFGDSLRDAGAPATPSDHATRLRGVVDAASAAGAPVAVVTDGELEEPELASTLPRGSRFVVLPKRERRDLAVTGLDAPHALLSGDTISARVTVLAGSAGSGAGRLELRLDDVTLDTTAIPTLAAFSERVVSLKGRAMGAERAAVLRAIVRVQGDGEPRNDTLALGADVTRAPAAVFVSSAPDYDAREAIAALRGVTSLPTRAFLRVAPGMWKTDAGLASVDERTVREAVRDAPLVILHGDTAIFGAPRSVTRGALLLFAPPATDDGEYLAFAAPASPLAATLGGLPFDSLPPVSVAQRLPKGEWEGLVTRRGGTTDDRRVALVGWETPRRVAVLGVSGLWRWRFRGGARSDAYAALFGSLYDWLAEGRTDRRAVVPDAQVMRAGVPVRWHRGSPADSTARVVLTKRGAARRDTLLVHFDAGSLVAETPPLAVGVYDVATSGGSSVLVVNPSSELLPRRPAVSTAAVGGAASLSDAPSLRDKGWSYALVVLLLCGEWLLRRRSGLR